MLTWRLQETNGRTLGNDMTEQDAKDLALRMSFCIKGLIPVPVRNPDVWANFSKGDTA